MAADTATAPAEASSSSGPTPSRTSEETPRPHPGPLPTKRGEIGYVESEHGTEVGHQHTSTDPPLPARHPADRDVSRGSPAVATASLSPIITSSQPATPSSAIPSILNSNKAKKSCFTHRCIGGFMLGTILVFIPQLILFGGTIAGWVVASKILSSQSDQPSSNTDNLGPGGNSFGNAMLFVHLVFVVAILVQLLFLERRIWRLRAERYSHLHPGEIIPTSNRIPWLGGGNPMAIAFSPWNRPPLPTYAAALRETGAGTGDVEDNMIAALPPPAYGTTRGSRLLLAGHLRNSLRAQRPPSAHSEMSQRGLEGGGPGSGSRPISYMSKDEQWEEIQDADRARRLEETLARLERPVSRN